jgi:hypothetical protein
MWVSSWLRKFFRQQNRTVIRKRRKAIRTASLPRPVVETLEDRVVPADLLSNPGLGPILPNVQLQAVYYSDLSSTSATNKLQTAKLDAYLAYLASSTSGFLAQLTQFAPNANGQVIGSGTQKSGLSAKFTLDNETISSSFGSTLWKGPTVYDDTQQGDVPGFSGFPGTAPPSGDIIAGNNSMLSSLIDNASTNGLSLKLDSNGNNETEFVVFVPYGVVVDAGFGANSIEAFAGYHSDFLYTGSNSTYDNQFIYYAVIPYPTTDPFVDGGSPIAPDLNAFEQQTVVTSHEVAECVTDPQPISGWVDQALGGSGEVGDLEAWNYMTIKNPSGGAQYVIQDLYSNLANGGTGGAQAPAVNQDMYINVFEDPTDNFSGVVGTMYYAGGHASSLNGFVDWGDGGSSNLTASSFKPLGGNWYNIVSSNPYSDSVGTQENELVTVTDNSNDATSAEGYVTLYDPSFNAHDFPNMGAVPIVSSPVYVAGTQPTIPTQVEGTAFTGTALANFYDTSNLLDSTVGYSATISWTDNGTPESVTSTAVSVVPSTGVYSVLAPAGLVFSDDQSSYNLSITIKNSKGNTLSAPITTTVQVTDPPVSATNAGPFNFSGGVSTGQITVATFTDPGLAAGSSPNPADYSATINWGDTTGTTTATLGNGGITYDSSTGVFTVLGTHTYAAGTSASSNYTISVAIAHNSAAVQTVDDSVTVTNPVASSIIFFTQPGTTVSGSAINSSAGVVVEVLDQFNHAISGNYTITISATGPGGFTGGSTTSVTVTSGTSASFTNLVLDTSGTYTLTASLTISSSTLTVTSSQFQVIPSQLLFSVQPPNTVTVESGASFVLTVQAKDANNALATNYTGAVTLAIAQDTAPTGLSPTGKLSGTLTQTSTTGIFQFTGLNLDELGTYTLSASIASGAVSSQSGSITVVASQLVFSTIPSSVVSGAGFTMIVQATDELGNLDKSFTSSVSLSEIGPSGASMKLNGSTNVQVIATAGQATFSTVTLDKAGSYTLTASSTPPQGAQITGTSNILVTPNQVAFTVQPPATIESGATFSVTVQAENADGSVASSYQGPISIAVDTHTPQYTGEIGNTSLNGTLTTNAGNGVAIFSGLSLDQLGAYTLKASAGTVNSQDSNSISVVANRLVFSSVPGTVASSANFQLMVQAEDDQGNVDKNFSSNVSLSASGVPGGTLRQNGSTSVQATASAGVATFTNLTLDKAGTYTLSAQATPAQGQLTGTSSSIIVGPSQLVFTLQPPSTVESSAAFSLTVQAEDSTNSVATNFQGLITITIGSFSSQYSGETGTDQLNSGATVSMNAVNGVASFTSSLNLNQLGTYTLQASGSSLTAQTNSIVVAANQLVFTTIPGSVGSGGSFQVIVKAEDELGNVDKNFTSSVSLSASGVSGGTLRQNGSTVVSATAVAGVATFNNLTLDLIGNYTVTATASPPQGNLSKTSSQISVGVLFTFVNSTPPSSVASGKAFSVQVGEFEMINGQMVAVNASGQMTLTVASGPGGIRGTTTVSFSNGVATFSNMILDHFGSYTLTAAANGLSVTSSTINVGPSTFKMLSAPIFQAGKATSLQFEAIDDLGNICTNFNSPVQFALTSAPFRGTIQGNLTPTVSNGIITLNNLVFSSPGKYAFTLTSGALSQSFSIQSPGSIPVP